MELTVWPAATKGVIGELLGASVYFHACRRGNNSITGVGAPLATAIGAPGTGGLTIAGGAVGQFVETYTPENIAGYVRNGAHQI